MPQPVPAHSRRWSDNARPGSCSRQVDGKRPTRWCGLAWFSGSRVHHLFAATRYPTSPPGTKRLPVFL